MEQHSIEDIERGKRLRKLRRDLDWTQQDLASKINRTFHAISKYENGIALSKDVVYRLAQVLGTTEDYILTGNESKKVGSSTKLETKATASSDSEPSTISILKKLDLLMNEANRELIDSIKSDFLQIMEQYEAHKEKYIKVLEDRSKLMDILNSKL
ncbi:MAG: helix-turn-helix domain-containing protein [bacterium]|nr:helix-turn-helix domain-containing protein [bacterium]